MNKLQTEWPLTAPLYYRQAVADQYHSPQSNEQNSEWHATEQFLDMSHSEFNSYQTRIFPPEQQ